MPLLDLPQEESVASLLRKVLFLGPSRQTRGRQGGERRDPGSAGCSEAAAAAGLWNPGPASHPVRRPRQHPGPGGSRGSSMGSGSSRRKRSCSPGADRPGRRGRSSSAPSGQGEEARGSQAPAPTELPSSSLRRPQPAEDSDWELLEEVLAECEEPGALPPTARGPAAPSPGPPRRGPAGDSWAGHDRHPRAAAAAAAAGSGRGSGAAGGDQPASLTRSMQDPENNNSASEFPVRSNKKPEMQSPISYDYSEEELMASIEREYCR